MILCRSQDRSNREHDTRVTLARVRLRWIRIRSVSGFPVGSSCLGPGATSQALQAGLPSVPEPDSIDQAAAAMVTGTNCWLAQTHISGELQNQVSHETIYRSLFIQARGVLKKELLEHLRVKRTIRTDGHTAVLTNAASDTFTPEGNDAKCGYACHTTVAAQDYIFTAYPKR